MHFPAEAEVVISLARFQNDSFKVSNKVEDCLCICENKAVIVVRDTKTREPECQAEVKRATVVQQQDFNRAWGNRQKSECVKACKCDNCKCTYLHKQIFAVAVTFF